MNMTANTSETLGLGLEHSRSKLFNMGKLKKSPRTPTVLKKNVTLAETFEESPD